jgi:hypothetical protein
VGLSGTITYAVPEPFGMGHGGRQLVHLFSHNAPAYGVVKYVTNERHLTRAALNQAGIRPLLRLLPLLLPHGIHRECRDGLARFCTDVPGIGPNKGFERAD